MMTITADEAFDAYEAARHRLPTVSPTQARAKEIRTLDELADQFDVFLLDAFGVLNVGEAVIPGVPERVAGLRSRGKTVLVVSNAASMGLDDLVLKYRGLGYAFDADDIVTSRSVLCSALNGRRQLHWGVMAPAGAQLDDLNLDHANLLGEDVQPYEDADGFLLIGTASWTEPRQQRLEQALARRARPVLVANPDIVAPRETGFSVEPGLFAHHLADALNLHPDFYGKPFGNIFDAAFDRLGQVDKARVVMVGDSLHTDILGARAFGIKSALIRDFGFLSGSDAHAAIERTGIVPDFLVDRP